MFLDKLFEIYINTIGKKIIAILITLLMIKGIAMGIGYVFKNVNQFMEFLF